MTGVNEAVAEVQNSKGHNSPETRPSGKQPQGQQTVLNIVPSCLECSDGRGQRALEFWRSLPISWMLHSTLCPSGCSLFNIAHLQHGLIDGLEAAVKSPDIISQLIIVC